MRNGLNEEDYGIKAVNTGTTVIVYVKCKLCHTPIKLQPKSKNAGIHHGISNWTKHVALCYFKWLKADSGQTKLVLKPIKVGRFFG